MFKNIIYLFLFNVECQRFPVVVTFVDEKNASLVSCATAFFDMWNIILFIFETDLSFIQKTILLMWPY